MSTQLETDNQSSKNQRGRLYQIIENNFDYSIVAGHYFPDSVINLLRTKSKSKMKKNEVKTFQITILIWQRSQ